MKNQTHSNYAELSSFESKEVEWFWEPFFPKNMLSLVEGDPGLGKSYALMSLAAKITQGGMLPNGEKIKVGRVLYVSAEDDPSYTIRPRIEALGGDVIRVRVQSEFEPFTEIGMRNLVEEIENFSPDLVIIDPIYSFYGDRGDLMSTSVIRPFLTKINGIARDNEVTIVAIRHLAKARKDKAIYQGAGAIDVIAIVRSAVLVATNPEDHSGSIWAHLKSNLAARGHSYKFRISHSESTKVGCFEWEGQSELKAEDLFAAGSEVTISKKQEGAELLVEWLEKGPRKQQEIEGLADSAGVSKRTLSRAKKSLGVVSEKKKRIWWWRMPERQRW
jgi:archaellum biogenesis ATPase FlaH